MISFSLAAIFVTYGNLSLYLSDKGQGMTFNVQEKYDNLRLSVFIREALGISRATLIKLKKLDNGIMLNGERVTVAATVKGGDILTLAIEDREDEVNPNVTAEGKMPEIVYEDEAVIAVNKPYGMPTHTSHGHRDDSLANSVCAYYAEKGQPFVFRAVNRLDLDTSGVVLIAKNRYYANILSRYMENGEFSKKYLAILDGEIAEKGEIEGYISREGESIIKRTLSKTETSGSDYSLTRYVRISASNGVSAVLASPATGRTHQLRVHFASLGAPIYGDTMYGNPSELIGRQALHAFELEFPSPVTGERITVRADVPSDMKTLGKELLLKF